MEKVSKKLTFDDFKKITEAQRSASIYYGIPVGYAYGNLHFHLSVDTETPSEWQGYPVIKVVNGCMIWKN